MNKNKIIMCSIGGVAAVAVLVLGYLSYAAWEERVEKEDELEAGKSSVERIKKSAIAPTKEALEAIEANTRSLAIWRDEAFSTASQGDMAVDAAMTPEAFKRIIGEEARDYAQKPGGAEGRIAKEGFEFGFKDLISGGSMPPKALLPILQRQWEDVKLFTETLSDSGATELVEVNIAEKKAQEPQAAKPKRPVRGKKEEVKKPLADEQGYEIKFKARPVALVKVINEFAKAQRFITVDSMTCVREEDVLQSALGEKDKDAAQQRPSRRRRRGRGSDASEEAEGEQGETSAKKGLVVDPATEAPFVVTMKLTTFDFGSKKSGNAEDAKEVAE
ncbi:MAG: Amuc_1100 family pilus-like protein [Kiritimatiellae bacterium]|nr:Amuc_1100 family pilus-like protein [Kiritimatiellia bacterium]